MVVVGIQSSGQMPIALHPCSFCNNMTEFKKILRGDSGVAIRIQVSLPTRDYKTHWLE